MVVLALLCTTAGAEMYKSIDEDGNVVYSDKPSPNATEFKSSPNMNTIQMPKPKLEQDEEEMEPEAGTNYKTMRITAPSNNATVIENSGNMTVTIKLEPELNTEAGDRVAVYVDGQAAARASSTRISLSSIDRGSHEVRAAVIDKSGNTLIRSGSVRFQMRRTSTLHDSGTSPPPGPTDSDGKPIRPGPQGTRPAPGQPGPTGSDGQPIRPGPQGTRFKPGPTPPGNPAN